MNFKEYQKKAKQTAMYMKGFDEKYPLVKDEIRKIIALSYVMNGLGEVGENQNKFKKIIRDDACVVTEEFKQDMMKELGDVLWYCANICEELGLSLDEVAEKNVEKLFSRQQRGVLTGSGDNR